MVETVVPQGILGSEAVRAALDGVGSGATRPPLNLGLNEGTVQPRACVDLLATPRTEQTLRRYPSPDNRELREAIARVDGVGPEHVFVHNGSGPILKQVIPDLLRRRILSSPLLVLRHLVSKGGYPIVTPRFTYGKVPGKAAELGLTVHTLPCGPDSGFRVAADAMAAYLTGRPALVYIANPNNPTGRVVISREELEPLIARFPRSTFWIDEAYIQYLDPRRRQSFSDLVPRYPNLFVMRTFSFAYGLAGARVGYLLADPDEVERQCARSTSHRVGTLSAQLAIVALGDADHLPALRRELATQRARFHEAMADYDGVEAFESDTHFVLCRFTCGARTGAWLAAELARRGVLIKDFSPYCGHSFDEFFRVTLGTEAENRVLIAQLDDLLG